MYMAQTQEPVLMIASDLDGTLLDSRQQITKGTAHALTLALERGIRVYACTGRTPQNAALVLRDAGLRVPVIGVNGALCTDADLNVLRQTFMDANAARTLYDIVSDAGIRCHIFYADGVVSRFDEKPHPEFIRLRARLREETGFEYSAGEAASLHALERRIYKMIVIADEGEMAALERMRDTLSGVRGLSVTSSWRNNLEIVPEGVSKGAAVTAMAQMEGIPLKNVMTLGDNENDLSMLSIAGYGVAMGGSDAAIQAACRYVTATNDEEGVRRAVERWALGA